MFGDQLVLAVIIILVTILQHIDCAVRCYKCSMVLPSLYSNETARLCANFDYSDKYIVNCEHSTLCMKKDFTVNLANPINGTVRDCAPQRYDYQQYKDGKWQLEVAIEEPYEEGCSLTDDKGLRNSRTQYCYCRGDLCNSATLHTSTNVVTVLSIIVGMCYFL